MTDRVTGLQVDRMTDDGWRMTGWQDDRWWMTGWQMMDDRMTDDGWKDDGWQDELMTGWQDELMTRWPMTRCPDDRMSRWQDDGKLRRRLTVWYILKINRYICRYKIRPHGELTILIQYIGVLVGVRELRQSELCDDRWGSTVFGGLGGWLMMGAIVSHFTPRSVVSSLGSTAGSASAAVQHLHCI